MFHIQQIDSLDRPELAPYRTLKRSAEHEALGIFVAEGDKIVQRLLASQFGVVSLLILERRLAEFEPLLRTRPESDITVYMAAEKSVMTALTGYELFQGVLAIGRIPAPAALPQVLATAPRPRLFAAADELANAENIGTLVRNCTAFDVQALLVGETSSSPFLRRAVRNSMGAIFQLPVVELGREHRQLAEPGRPPRRDVPRSTLAQTLQELRRHGIQSIAAHPSATGKTLSQADFTGDCCVVFGSEGQGISAAVLAACDEAVAVPMANGVDSLNVSAAAAVFLYEARRQRGKA
ncbi:MAG TPA: RNA methyltransferase [Dongiaceae bacterium]|nr:RNA methyltransferase [Dongiaceae bacterium]